ncbi:MAG: hypothetical protein ACR2N4_07715 [Jatrophihabitans sp.]
MNSDTSYIRGLSRRGLLRAGGAALAAGAFGLAGGRLASPAAASVTPATLPASQYIDLSQPSYDYFPSRNVALHESHHALQGIAFDNVNHRIYIIQQRNGSSGDDLCVNQLDYSGNVTGYMYLPNAGHGVSLGVEPVGTSSYIWAEADSSAPDNTGRGTALQRFKFVSGAAPSSTKFLTGSTNVTCATDPINQRLMVRREVSGSMHFYVYPLAAAAANDFPRRWPRSRCRPGSPAPSRATRCTAATCTC